MTTADIAFPVDAVHTTPDPGTPDPGHAAVAKKPAAKRTYVVLKADAEIGSWHTVGAFEASTEQQALATAIETEGADGGGTYVAVARWAPRKVEVQPIQATRLVWS